MRPDRVIEVLNSKSAQDLLHSPLLMRLAYLGPDSYPRAIPIGYVWDGRSFIVCTAEAAPKVQALRSNPRVALTIDTETQPPHILLVRGRASVEIVEGVPPEYLDASRKWIGPDQWDAFERQVRACTGAWRASGSLLSGRSSSISKRLSPSRCSTWSPSLLRRYQHSLRPTGATWEPPESTAWASSCWLASIASTVFLAESSTRWT